MHSFIEQIFNEHLPYAKHCTKCWGTIENKIELLCYNLIHNYFGLGFYVPFFHSTLPFFFCISSKFVVMYCENFSQYEISLSQNIFCPTCFPSLLTRQTTFYLLILILWKSFKVKNRKSASCDIKKTKQNKKQQPLITLDWPEMRQEENFKEVDFISLACKQKAQNTSLVLEVSL